MCKAKSMVVTKNEVYESAITNSHEDIKSEFKLRDTELSNLMIVELHPKDGVYICSTNRDDWKLVLENEPEWYKQDKHLYQDRIFGVLFDKAIPRWKTDGINEGMDLSSLEYKILPDFKKIKVGGYFSCDNNQLTSLAGAPQKVGGGFYCNHNQLTSLAGAPQKVGGGFYCNHNQLTSLAGAPQKVGRDFSCNDNQLTSLAGAPQKVGGYFSCYDNQLTSLAGAPKEVGGYFSCDNNQLTSLAGAPKEVGGYFSCDNNQLTSLAGAPQKVGGGFYCGNNPKLKETYREYLQRSKEA